MHYDKIIASNRIVFNSITPKWVMYTEAKSQAKRAQTHFTQFLPVQIGAYPACACLGKYSIQKIL